MKDFSKYDDKQLIGFISLEGKEKESAFKEIYFRYAKRIFSHCNLKCVNQDEAKYMHQEIWMIFFQAIKDGKTDIKLPHYLYGIARNIYLQNCKKQNKQTIFNEDKFEIDSIISPNPSNENATLLIDLEKQSKVSISIYNNLGIEIIRILDNQNYEKGLNKFNFYSKDLPSGVYYSLLKTDYYKTTIKFIVIH